MLDDKVELKKGTAIYTTESGEYNFLYASQEIVEVKYDSVGSKLSLREPAGKHLTALLVDIEFAKDHNLEYRVIWLET